METDQRFRQLEVRDGLINLQDLLRRTAFRIAQRSGARPERGWGEDFHCSIPIMTLAPRELWLVFWRTEEKSLIVFFSGIFFSVLCIIRRGFRCHYRNGNLNDAASLLDFYAHSEIVPAKTVQDANMGDSLGSGTSCHRRENVGVLTRVWISSGID